VPGEYTFASCSYTGERIITLDDFTVDRDCPYFSPRDKSEVVAEILSGYWEGNGNEPPD
jgi:hypothetical protein